jgi:hypothetical protein
MPKYTGSALTSCVAIFPLQPSDRSDVASQGLFIAGAGILICSLTIQSYVIDTYTVHAASGLAAVGTLRSLAGFGFPLFAPAMYKSLGYGKGNTVLFSVAVAIGCPSWVALLVRTFRVVVLIAQPLVGPGYSGSTVNVFEAGVSMHPKFNAPCTHVITPRSMSSVTS